MNNNSVVKVVYNTCFGGFSLSKEAIDMYEKLSGKTLKRYGYWADIGGISRSDPTLVHVVETLREAAWGPCSRLSIATVPEGCLYRIDEYDGRESVETKDTYEWTLATNSPT